MLRANTTPHAAAFLRAIFLPICYAATLRRCFHESYAVYFCFYYDYCHRRHYVYFAFCFFFCVFSPCCYAAAAAMPPLYAAAAAWSRFDAADDLFTHATRRALIRQAAPRSMLESAHG